MFGFGSKSPAPEPAYSVELDSGAQAHDTLPSSATNFTESLSASDDAELQVQLEIF